MADVTSIYGNPIKDAVARADIATNTQDISDLKDGLTAIESDVTDLKEDSSLLDDRVTALEQGGTGSGVPSIVKNAICTLLNAAVYSETGLTDEIAIVNDWAANHATAITLNKKTLSIAGVDTVTLVATLTPADATDTVLWASSDTSVAVVNNGVVTSVGNGSCTITVTAGSVSATCSVTVSGIISYYTITNTLNHVSNNNTAIAVGDGDSYTATLTSDSGYEINYVSITMGGLDITSTAYDNGVINIANVTGNIEINASAVKQRVLINNWNLKQSLTDTVGNITAYLNGATTTSDGISFSNRNGQYLRFPNVIKKDITVEVDVHSMSFVAAGSQNGRFIMFSNDDSVTSPTDGFIYQNGDRWNTYYGGWGTASSEFSGDSAFSGKTVVVKIDDSGEYSIYCDNKLVNPARTPNTQYNTLCLSANGYGFVNMVISAVRIYEGVE